MSEEEVEGYYEKTRSESREIIASALPTIALDVSAAILIWLFGKLVFVPIAEGIYFFGYPLPQLLNFVILLALAIIVLRILVDVRRLIDGLAGYAACEIGAPYEVSPEEVEHYRTALRGIFDIIVVSLVYMLFVDFLSRIHVALSGVVLFAIVVWAIYRIWRVVQAVSEEIRRYTTMWAQKTLSRS
ncbi:MAG: hypothetical protein AYL32_005980 [Candidatus Bathyarchaeota archaeon B26-2]|nr:MAG: hypothetical protein AYL32_005980 [Candidatus Bathyarchaeota archaeon B26-2]